MKQKLSSRSTSFIIMFLVAALALIAILSTTGNPNLLGTAADLPTDAPDTSNQMLPPVTLENSGNREIIRAPTDLPPTSVPPTNIPPTDVPPTDAPPTDVPPTDVPPTDVPPTDEPPTDIPPTATPLDVDEEILPSVCQMEITDNGDTNPFTFSFEAVDPVEIASFAWDLGEGDTPTGPGPHVHTYSGIGDYNITLDCTTSQTPPTTMNLTGQVSIQNTVVAAFEVTPYLVGVSPFNISLVDKSLGMGLSYAWTITGPETHNSTDPNPNFTLTALGEYTIRLDVTDGVSSTFAEATVHVIAEKPEASFSVSPVAGSAPLDVVVTGIDLGAGPIDTWDYTMGDGTTYNVQSPGTHTYNAEGTYTIRLDYSGPGGSGYAEKQVLVIPSTEPVKAIFDYDYTGRDVGAGNVEICFNNLSTGNVGTSEWDLGDSTIISDNSSRICHTYVAGGVKTVTLTVAHADTGVLSTATNTVDLIAAPIAQFTISATNILWDEVVHFDGSPSSGSITDYEWDFDADGVIDSTEIKPQNIKLLKIGSNVIRLTVRGTGGESFAEGTVIVERRDITCNINGNFNPEPGSTGLLYEGIVGDLNGRAVTEYKWTVTGAGVNANYATKDVTLDWTTDGAYFIVFSATAEDGASCTVTQNIQIAYPAPTCALTGNFGPLPDGSTYTYGVNVTDAIAPARPLTYEWFLNDVSVGTGATHDLSWIAEKTGENLRVEVTAENPDGTFIGCLDARTFDVKFPALTCNVAGQGWPRPQMPDNPTRSYDYTASITGGLAGRNITGYTWNYGGSGVGSEVGTAPTNDKYNIYWQWDDPDINETVSVTITVEDSQNKAYTCNASKNMNIRLPDLTCSGPSGDTLPVIGETVTFGRNVSNTHGRSYTDAWWTIEERDATDTSWLTPAILTAGDVNSVNYQFNDPGKKYRVTYFVEVDQPSESETCSVIVNTPGSANIGFNCNKWITTSFNTPDPNANYSYTVEVDNTKAIPLTYTWTIKDYQGNVEWTYTDIGNTTDGNVSTPNILGSAMTPADADYLIEVLVDDPGDSYTDYQCSFSKTFISGELQLQYTWTVDKNKVEVEDLICLTNASKTSHDDINALTYEWTLAAGAVDVNGNPLASFTGKDLPCFHYDTEGQYQITLRGTNASGKLTDTFARTFKVFGHQNIAIDRSDATYAPAQMDFSAIHENIDTFAWKFTNLDTGTVINKTGQDVTGLWLNEKGNWQVDLVGEGDLETNSAQIVFELISTDDIRAAFTPSVYAGKAVLHVCFNDQSFGNNINYWGWDFNDDGIKDLEYTDANKPAEICYDFDTDDTDYLVRLDIANTSGLTAFATNLVRTFNAIEAAASFAIDAQGGGKMCFTSLIDPGITVTGWDFGDGIGTGGPEDQICYTYQGEGTYLVSMYIEDSGGGTGHVDRPVIVIFDPPGTPPALTPSGDCSTWGQAVFTVNNTGGDMLVPDRITIVDDTGTIHVEDDLLLLANSNRQYLINDYYGTLTLNSVDFSLSANTTCYVPPTITAAGSCQIDGTAVFTVDNTSPDTAADQNYQVTDAGGNVVANGTLNIATKGQQVVTVPNIYGQLTFTTDGPEGVTTEATANTDCPEPPVLTGEATCAANGTAIFIITNTSADRASDQTYTITDDGGNVVDTGQLLVPVNGSVQIEVADTFGQLTFESNGPEGPTTNVNVNTSCGAPPEMSATGTCQADGTAVFTVTNSSAGMNANQSYTVMDSVGNTVDQGVLSVPANGGTQDITITNVYGELTFNTFGPQGVTTEASATVDCDEPPVLSGSATCESNGTAIFTITNSSLESDANQSYEVVSSDGTVVDSGTLTVARNSSSTINVRNHYGLLTFRSNGSEGPTTEITVDSDCAEPPVLTAVSECAANGTAIFTITNDSTMSAANQTYEVRDVRDNVIDSGTLSIQPNGGKQMIVIENTFGLLTLTSSGPEGQTTEVTAETTCQEPPVLTAEGTCAVDGTAVFTVSNNSTMNDAVQDYSITDTEGSVVKSGTMTVMRTSSTNITVTDYYELLTFSSSGDAGTTTEVTAQTDCDEPPMLTGDAQCDGNGSASFSITNNSSDTTADQSYDIIDETGVTVSTGTLLLPPNTTETVTIIDQIGLLIFRTNGDAGPGSELSLETDCSDAASTDGNLTGSFTCSAVNEATFTVTNNGSDQVDQDYLVTDSSGTAIETGLLSLASSESLSLIVTSSDMPVTFVTTGVSDLSIDADCSLIGDGDDEGDNGGEDGDIGGDDNGTPRLFTDLSLIPGSPDPSLERPAWDAIGVGGAVCVDWLLYHTNMTGDWEVFRLGELPQYPTADVNLSQGRGTDIIDMAPTRSPDAEWVAFTSNRDGNWELYVTKVDNSITRRMTYNTTAKDIDPVWSPDGRYLIFESDRDGNWELYLFDLATGAETRLTDDPFSDINAFWSPDSQRLVFQSDRDGLWQIYEYDLATGEETRLSDGTSNDHDPAYAFVTEQIAFRSYTADSGENSVISILDRETNTVKRVSDPAGDAANHTWYMDDSIIAYQSDLDGDEDIYVYDLEQERTRLVTDNEIHDYAPTWYCSAPLVVFTSDVTDDPNIFNTPALPIEADPILVDSEGSQMTFDPADDVYPENSPAEENASREGNVPPHIGADN